MAGIWEGYLTVNATRTVHVVVKIRKDDKEGWISTLDDPDRNVKGVPCDLTTQTGDSILISVAIAKAKYEAKYITASDSMTGFWTQGKFHAPLTLKKVEHVTQLIRPQTPLPPYNYITEDIEYDNPDKSVHFGATFTKPYGPGKFPVALLITGSGQQDRDETILSHKPFAVIANYLTLRGVAVLRVDDRGMGKTKGDLSKATSKDFAQDAMASLDYLKTRQDIDTQKIGLIGHSEGGMIAPMIATQRKDVAFIVMLAGPGIKIIDAMTLQNIDLIKSAGVSPKEAETYGTFYKKLVQTLLEEKLAAAATGKATDLIKAWQKEVGDTLVLHTTGITDGVTMNNYINAMVTTIKNPWYDFFLRYDPTPNLQKLQIPILALNGAKDLQVASQPNLTAIQLALTKAGNKDVTTQELPNLNHLFQTCKKCTIAEYGELQETFSPDALKIMGDWISQRVK